MGLKGNTIPECLQERAQVSGDNIAYIFDNVTYTWGECNLIADRLAASLKEMGVKKGSHVGLWGVNTIEWVLYYFAVQKLGATGVLINYSYKENELQSMLYHTDVEFLAIGEPKGDLDYMAIIGHIEKQLPKLKKYFQMHTLAEPVIGSVRHLSQEMIKKQALLVENYDVEVNDTAVIIFTSGTTLRPKGVMLAHGQLMRVMSEIVERMQWDENDTELMPLPFFHGSGANCGILAGLQAGLKMVIQRYYSSEAALTAIQQYRCTVFNGVPTMWLLMMRHAGFGEFDLSSLRSGTISGAPVSPECYRQICRSFQGASIQPAYGMTETTTLNTIHWMTTDQEEKAVSAGPALDSAKIRIWQCAQCREAPTGTVGEIQIQGPCIMQGYYGQEDKTREQMMEDGWFRTGDAGLIDAKGNLCFKVRLSEMIVRGGENISPIEIEQCIEKFNSDFKAVKVTGVPDPILQQEIAAFIQTSQDIDEKQLKDYVKQNLADYKVPKYVFAMASLPMTGSGKIDTKALKEMAKNKIEKGKI